MAQFRSCSPATTSEFPPIASCSESFFWDPEMVDLFIYDMDSILAPPSYHPEIGLHSLIETTVPQTATTSTMNASLSRSDSPMSHSSLLPSNTDPLHSLDHLAPVPQTSAVASTTPASLSSFSTTGLRRGTKRSASHSSTDYLTGSDTPSSPVAEDARIQEKRRRNKMASRRLRQRQVEHVSDLESRLDRITQERDALRLEMAKWEAEVMVLRKLVGCQKMA
ncbi:bZIP transcription factor [Aspergillus homomorphus CBS 101889]|uniref:BZIP domain-containing protein n=1 Tax=Aspergillus homomorphus (strain CBS 101889) TaxID=1450537 RepID=A0A395I7J1_ASPHC|nr:hypothetical protein BO97DRAFT_404534 [Aspergillus homomorphus CBS 101889]RAL14174.1 hypothetical protein BO97DRAFT_404534 [Aspergillus homomorphus CBS 101889]